DEHGRSTALLRWDRRRSPNEKSSAWIRSHQPQQSGGMFLPRAGWEVLLAFQGTSADEPHALGRLDNGVAVPAESLPHRKVRSAFGSRTTPGGGSANVLSTDDAAGNEGMLLNASGDYDEVTAIDKMVQVAAADVHVVGATRKQLVGAASQIKVDAARTLA